MATLTVVYWRDIPAEVIVKEGRMSARRQLYGRLLEAIDRTAMRSDAYDTDSSPRGGTAIPSLAATTWKPKRTTRGPVLRRRYDDACLQALFAAGGREAP